MCRVGAAAGLLVALGLSTAACSGSQPRHLHDPAAYLAIAEPANRRLDAAIDAIHGPDRSDLPDARRDLHLVSAVERSFDRALLRLPLTGAARTTARNLVIVNESREGLTDQAAASTTVAQLHGSVAALTAADELVEGQVRVLRTQLGLPPPGDG